MYVNDSKEKYNADNKCQQYIDLDLCKYKDVKESSTLNTWSDTQMLASCWLCQ